MKKLVITFWILALVASAATAARAAEAPAPAVACGSMDLLFIIDDTGDMGGAIANLRASFMTLIAPLAVSTCGDVRFGIITFKDDVQVDLPFTSSASACQASLNAISVGGGNNLPEASNEAMKEAFDTAGSSCAIPPGFDPSTWRSGSCRVAILVTGAPPGGCNDVYDSPADSLDGLAQARRAAENGILMGTICDYGTSINLTASSLLAQYAAITQGAYGATQGGAGLATYVATAMSRCTSPLTIGWADLHWPLTLNTTAGVASELVFGQVWIDGVTSQPGATIGLVAELGYGPEGSDPSVDPAAWQWTPAAFNLDDGNNDEFMARLTVAAPGTYDYCYRYSNRGAPWVYGDLDGSTNEYSPAQAGSLVVRAPTGVPGAPAALRLHPNQPNPFNPLTTIRFDLPAAGPVRLAVYDLAGRLVRVLVEEARAAGSHEAVWDGRDAAGVPLARRNRVSIGRDKRVWD
jgi:hypothetical protein